MTVPQKQLHKDPWSSRRLHGHTASIAQVEAALLISQAIAGPVDSLVCAPGSCAIKAPVARYDGLCRG